VQGASAFNGKSVAGPETNTSVEAGIKADLMDKRARLSFSAFRYTVKDQQLTAVGGAANANILLNAKKATGQGFELDLQAILSDNLLATWASATTTPRSRTGPRGGGLRGLHRDRPQDRCRPGADRRQPAAAGAEDHRQLHAEVHRRRWAAATSTPTPTGPTAAKVNFFLYESTEFTGKALLEGGLRLGYCGPTASTTPPPTCATSPTRSASSAASTSTT
jgi:iron complex outermembrane receptor protein